MSQYRPHRQLVTRQKMTEAKANAYFFAYYSLGVNRSMAKLQHKLADLDLPRVALNTLTGWSSRYGWMARIAQMDAAAQAQLEGERIQAVVDMNRRQATLGKALQGMAALGLKTLNPLQLDARDVATLSKDGVHIERLALGEATNREEVAVQVWNRLIVPIVAVFKDCVVGLPDAEARSRRFGEGVNQIVEGQLGQVGEKAQ